MEAVETPARSPLHHCHILDESLDQSHDHSCGCNHCFVSQCHKIKSIDKTFLSATIEHFLTNGVLDPSDDTDAPATVLTD